VQAIPARNADIRRVEIPASFAHAYTGAATVATLDEGQFHNIHELLKMNRQR
jgi:hypothetical protein